MRRNLVPVVSAAVLVLAVSVAGYYAMFARDAGRLAALNSELDSELRDGRTFKLKPGMSYQVSDFGDAAHRSSTKTGAKLFIVD